MAFVCPILEYGCTTYNPLNSKLTGRLDIHRAFCLPCHLAGLETVDDLLLKADLPLLAKRRDFATLCQLFKIVHNLCSSPNPYNLHPRPSPGLRNLNSMALDTPFCRLSLTQKSLYPYAPTLWKDLPDSHDSNVKCPRSLLSSLPPASCFASRFGFFGFVLVLIFSRFCLVCVGVCGCVWCVWCGGVCVCVFLLM